MKPIKFEALLKNTIWGGNDINQLKQLPEGTKAVGESWEISGVPGNETIVTAGDDLGATLPALIRKYGATLVGQANFERYGETFPLLIKFISAAQPLSIQVHPDDAMANTMGHPFGKTEMWYIIGTHEGARLCSGFAHDYSADAYAQGVEDGSIEEHLAYHTTHVGDCFFIPAGRIHSIGAGNFLIEIQQSSNDTFRVYDFNRTDDPLGADAEKLCYTDKPGDGTNNGGTPATGDTGVLVWVIALPVTILAAAFVLKRKEREA